MMMAEIGRWKSAKGGGGAESVDIIFVDGLTPWRC